MGQKGDDANLTAISARARPDGIPTALIRRYALSIGWVVPRSGFKDAQARTSRLGPGDLGAAVEVASEGP